MTGKDFSYYPGVELKGETILMSGTKLLENVLKDKSKDVTGENNLGVFNQKFQELLKSKGGIAIMRGKDLSDFYKPIKQSDDERLSELNRRKLVENPYYTYKDVLRDAPYDYNIEMNQLDPVKLEENRRRLRELIEQNKNNWARSIAEQHVPKDEPDDSPKDVPKDSPKDSYPKVSASLVPSSAIILESLAFEDGARKHGGSYNWRIKPVNIMSTLDGVLRHIYSYIDGEEFASDSGVPHLAHARARLAILIDAQESKTLIDDRPSKGTSSELLEKYYRLRK